MCTMPHKLPKNLQRITVFVNVHVQRSSVKAFMVVPKLITNVLRTVRRVVAPNFPTHLHFPLTDVGTLFAGSHRVAHKSLKKSQKLGQCKPFVHHCNLACLVRIDDKNHTKLTDDFWSRNFKAPTTPCFTPRCPSGNRDPSRSTTQ